MRTVRLAAGADGADVASDLELPRCVGASATTGQRFVHDAVDVDLTLQLAASLLGSGGRRALIGVLRSRPVPRKRAMTAC